MMIEQLLDSIDEQSQTIKDLRVKLNNTQKDNFRLYLELKESEQKNEYLSSKCDSLNDRLDDMINNVCLTLDKLYYLSVNDKLAQNSTLHEILQLYNYLYNCIK